MRFRSPAVPSLTCLTESGRHGAVCGVTLKPDFSRLSEKAWKFSAGFGMYGRETPVGYQKSTFTGSVSPADCSSCLALFGLYGYFGRLLVRPTICGGRTPCATTARPK